MANGEGYLRQRSKGSWTFSIHLGKDEQGKPRQLVRTVRGTKDEAQAEMARLIVERDQGVELKPEVVTFAELAQRWLDSRRGDLAESTVATYEILLSTHILRSLGRLKVRDIKPLHIEAAKAAVVQRGCSRKSALNVFRLLNAILKQAVRWQLIVRNPCEAVDAPRPKRFIPHTPTPDELEALLRGADATPYAPVVRLALLTGARQGELLALRWGHVDWEAMTLTVPGTKTAGSMRSLDVGEETISLLRRQRVAEREKALKLGPGADCGQEAATVFTNLVGKPIDAGGLKRTRKRVVKHAGVGHVRFHDLRHASATYMLSGGMPLKS